MEGNLCRVKADLQQAGKWRYHKLVGAVLKQYRSPTDLEPAREIDVRGSIVSFPYPLLEEGSKVCFDPVKVSLWHSHSARLVCIGWWNW
jgi:hypothetical protein